MYGYHGRILHVNLTNGQTHIETFDETFAQTYLGGNGFAIRLLYERLTPGIDPLSPDNMLVFAVGPATDTPIPGATRCFVGTKSPLTGLFFDSTFGGMFAALQKCPGLKPSQLPGVPHNRRISWCMSMALRSSQRQTSGGGTPRKQSHRPRPRTG